MDNALKEIVKQLIDNLIECHRKSSDERHKIHELEWEASSSVSVLGEVEVMSGNIVGIAQRLLTRKKRPNLTRDMLDLLNENKIFNSTIIVGWFIKNSSEFRSFSSYLHNVEYLRLFISEVILNYLEISE